MKGKKMKKLVSIITLVFMFSILAGCSQSSQSEPKNKMTVVASVYSVYEFTKAVAGDRVNVALLLPPGVEAHDWEPAASDMKKINAANAFFYNGGGMEPWVAKLSTQAGNEKKPFVETGANLFVQREGKHDMDPHIWLDPVLAQKQVVAIKDALIKIDPAGKDIYEKNAGAYLLELQKLDSDFNALAQNSKGAAFIPMHAAFGYLAERYGWNQIALMGIAPHAEPNPAQMAKIMKIVQENNVRYLFVEPNVSSKIMEEIAKETNTQLLPLDTVEDASGQKDDSYLQRMRANLASLNKSFTR